jgi:hypothetical protein
VNRLRTGIVGILLGLAVSGCYISVRDDSLDNGWAHDSEDWKSRQEHNLEVINGLELGRTMSSVTSELGSPDLSESFLRDGRAFRVLLYRTRLVREDGRVTRDETTPLVFVDGELVGWGESAIENALP